MRQHRPTRTIAAVALAVAGALGAGTWLAGSSTLPGGPTPADAQPTYDKTLKFTGAASCGGSKCHASTSPKAEHPKMNESEIWETKDYHAKAFKTLRATKSKLGKPSPEIAANLKIGKADTSERCLVCHAVNVPPAQRGPKFDIAEGVGCDGCHGPAEKWLDGHAEKGWTHEKSVSLGMYDTKDMLKRAEKCVSCHLQIDTDLVAAGHPDLAAFELDSFSAQMPRHWGEKGQFATTRVWGTGQVISLREAARQVSSRAKGAATTPKQLEEAAAKVRGHFAVVKHMLAITSPDAVKAIEADVAAVAAAASKGDKAAAGAAAEKVAAAAQREAPKVAGREHDRAATLKIIKALGGDADAIAAAGVRAGEQVAYALDRLYLAYSGGKGDKAAKDALDRIFGELEDPAKFAPARFAAELKGFDKAVK
jgi:hypothetical protein